MDFHHDENTFLTYIAAFRMLIKSAFMIWKPGGGMMGDPLGLDGIPFPEFSASLAVLRVLVVPR